MFFYKLSPEQQNGDTGQCRKIIRIQFAKNNIRIKRRHLGTPHLSKGRGGIRRQQSDTIPT